MPPISSTPKAPRERIGYEVDYGAPRERVGYSIDYVQPMGVKSIERESFWKVPRNEARLGLLMVAGALIWTAKTQTLDLSNPLALVLTRGPKEICAIGVLVWLHAIWRRSVRVK